MTRSAPALLALLLCGCTAGRLPRSVGEPPLVVEPAGLPGVCICLNRALDALAESIEPPPGVCVIVVYGDKEYRDVWCYPDGLRVCLDSILHAAATAYPAHLIRVIIRRPPLAA